MTQITITNSIIRCGMTDKTNRCRLKETISRIKDDIFFNIKGKKTEKNINIIIIVHLILRLQQ